MSERKEEVRSDRPAFSSPLYAALRQGAKEVGQALRALPDSIQPVEEPGTLGNPTQMMVTRAIDGMEPMHSEYDDFKRDIAAQGVDFGREQEMERD